MLGSEALLVDRERAAIERLGLGQPVGGLQQLGQVVEHAWRRWDARDRELFSSMASARRISGSASASRLVAWSSCGQVVEGGGDVGMLRAEALLVDGERAAIQRLGLGQPVGGLQQLGQVVEVAGDVWVVGTEALLVDGERAAIERLGLGEAALVAVQLSQLIERVHEKGVRPNRPLVDGKAALVQSFRIRALIQLCFAGGQRTERPREPTACFPVALPRQRHQGLGRSSRLGELAHTIELADVSVRRFDFRVQLRMLYAQLRNDPREGLVDDPGSPQCVEVRGDRIFPGFV